PWIICAAGPCPRRYPDGVGLPARCLGRQAFNQLSNDSTAFAGTAGLGSLAWPWTGEAAAGKAVPRVQPAERGRLLRWLLQRLQVGDHVIHLRRIEPELRHGRMAGDDPLDERFGKLLDRVAQMQSPERRRYLERTVAVE